MYKVDIQDINKKIAMIKRSQGTMFLLVLSGVMLVSAYFETDKAIYIYFSIFFTLGFVKHYFISPLLGKIELMENDIRRLKQKLDIEEEKHY